MRAFYSGDVNIENGGYFYSLEGVKWGYVNAVRVVPCSDAGGPDNCYWIDEMTVNLRKGDKLSAVLQCCGLTEESLPTGAARMHAIIDCHVMHGEYDVRQSRAIKIGPDDPFFSDHKRKEWRNFERVRANSSLRRIARGML